MKKQKTAPKAKGLYARIQAVQQEVRTVIKLGFNEFHKYKYTYERDYIAEIKPLLGKHGLVITSDVKEYKVEPVKTDSFIGYVFLNFTITDLVSKQSLTVGFPGQGEDKGDKSLPKALTMATKYFLAKTFLVETGDDSEQDKKGQKTKLEPNEAFEVAKKMILATKNVAGLIEYDGNMKAGKTFNAKQKAELHTLINSRVTTLTENGKK